MSGLMFRPRPAPGSGDMWRERVALVAFVCVDRAGHEPVPTHLGLRRGVAGRSGQS